MNLKFIAAPRFGRLEQITSWLREENEDSGCGFYCNITTINKAFADKELVCVTSKNKAIGFAVFTRHRYTARIDIAEICPSHCESGVGRFLVENCIEMFAKRNIQVVDLECAPRSSESFWHNMGFYRVPEEALKSYSQYNKPIRMFRPTCQIQNQKSLHEKSDNSIELFDCRTWECEGRKPRWSWPIFTLKGTEVLDKPIIHPAHRDWCVRWKKEDKIIKTSEVKHFCNDSSKWGEFLIITQLPTVS
ncbi:MAG: hypothetical protein FD174_4156 [Geobacteraceae bacterium]|nr:MAG: hypothetical protein FD174_4156 [Geobacteraceae bacterium]